MSEPLSDFAFNFNVRPAIKGREGGPKFELPGELAARLYDHQRDGVRWGGATRPRVFAVDPALAFRDFQRLNLKHDELLSNVAASIATCATTVRWLWNLQLQAGGLRDLGS